MRSRKRLSAGMTRFERVYRDYLPRLISGIRSTYGAGPPDPEDVAQAAFAKLSMHIERSEIRNPEAYVWIAARNIILSEKRATSVRQKNQCELSRRVFSETCDVFDPERVFMGREKIKLILETLDAMPERRRNIFILVRVHGLTLEEAGRRCGVSRTSAIRHVAIATQLLGEALSSAVTPQTLTAAE